MDYSQTHQDLMKASRAIEKRHNYMCGLEIENLSDEDAQYKKDRTHFFFNSPDGQNVELYNELKTLGYRSSGYNAGYDWSVTKGNVRVRYTEGDIYLSTTNK